MAAKQKDARPPKMKKIGGIIQAKKQQDRRLKRQGKQAQKHSVTGLQQGKSSKFKRMLKVTRERRIAKKLLRKNGDKSVALAKANADE
jgi:hypothetical protein